MKNEWQRQLPGLALLLSALLLTYSYWPVLGALLDPDLQFHYGDFQTKVGPDSAQLRKETALFTFTNGDDTLLANNRFFILTMFAGLSDIFPFSDSQFHAALILLSMLLGCAGIYLLALRFESRPGYQAALVFSLALFYFLNFWAVDRLAHTWIWFTYAVFPMFLFLGLEHISSGKMTHLVLYSMLFGFFGFLPHSFIYLLIIHGILALYCLLSGKGWKACTLFALVPALIYVGMNLPAIAMYPYLSQLYPFSVDKESPHMLSRHGEIYNVLAFSNPWWPQVPYDHFGIVFRYSGILIFALCALSFARAALVMKDRRLLALCITAMLAFIFIAMGTKNPAMEWLIFKGVDSGLGQLLGIFREWGRMSIMIPVFLSLALIISVSALREREKAGALALFGILVAVNILSSPAWEYMELYRAIRLPDDYSIFRGFSPEHKTLFIITDYVIRQNYPAQVYPSNSAPDRLMDKGTGSQRVLDALNVDPVVREENVSGERYAWMDCEDSGILEVCQNPGAGGMLSAYRPVVATNQTRYMDAVLLGTGGGYAVSGPVPGAEFAIVEPHPDGIEPPPGARHIYILEGERDFGKLGKLVKAEADHEASSGGAAVFSGVKRMATNVTVRRSGTYMLALRGRGEFLVKMGDDFRGMRIDDTGFSYLGPLDLEAGLVPLSVTGEEGSALDALWIYESDKTLPETFRPVDAEVVSARRIAPTRWSAEAEAGAPFVLALAEPFSRPFEATVTDEEGNVEKVKPVMILGGINGFPVNLTGKLAVEVSFTAQDAYTPAFASTGLTLMACVGYLAVQALKRGHPKNHRG